MPRKKKSPAADAALPVIPSELIDQIVKGPMSPDPVSFRGAAAALECSSDCGRHEVRCSAEN